MLKKIFPDNRRVSEVNPKRTPKQDSTTTSADNRPSSGGPSAPTVSSKSNNTISPPAVAPRISAARFKKTLDRARSNLVPLVFVLDELYDLVERLPEATYTKLNEYLANTDILREAMTLFFRGKDQLEQSCSTSTTLATDQSSRYLYRYNWIIAAMVCNGMHIIRQALVKSPILVASLFNYFARPTIDEVVAMHTVRIIAALFHVNPAIMLEILKKNPKHIQDLVKNIRVPLVNQLFPNLIAEKKYINLSDLNLTMPFKENISFLSESKILDLYLNIYEENAVFDRFRLQPQLCTQNIINVCEAIANLTCRAILVPPSSPTTFTLTTDTPEDLAFVKILHSLIFFANSDGLFNTLATIVPKTFFYNNTALTNCLNALLDAIIVSWKKLAIARAAQLPGEKKITVAMKENGFNKRLWDVLLVPAVKFMRKSMAANVKNLHLADNIFSLIALGFSFADQKDIDLFASSGCIHFMVEYITRYPPNDFLMRSLRVSLFTSLIHPLAHVHEIWINECGLLEYLVKQCEDNESHFQGEVAEAAILILNYIDNMEKNKTGPTEFSADINKGLKIALYNEKLRPLAQRELERRHMEWAGSTVDKKPWKRVLQGDRIIDDGDDLLYMIMLSSKSIKAAETDYFPEFNLSQGLSDFATKTTRIFEGLVNGFSSKMGLSEDEKKGGGDGEESYQELSMLGEEGDKESASANNGHRRNRSEGIISAVFESFDRSLAKEGADTKSYGEKIGLPFF